MTTDRYPNAMNVNEIMPDLEAVWIVGYERLKNSHNGNPRYSVAFTDGGQYWSYQTKVDSMVNYEIENMAHRKDLLSVWLTKGRRIYKIATILRGL